MAFGLTYAVPILQNSMPNVLAGLLNSKCFVCIDVVLVVGKDFEEHIENLKKVFMQFQMQG